MYTKACLGGQLAGQQGIDLVERGAFGVPEQDHRPQYPAAHRERQGQHGPADQQLFQARCRVVGREFGGLGVVDARDDQGVARGQGAADRAGGAHDLDGAFREHQVPRVRRLVVFGGHPAHRRLCRIVRPGRGQVDTVRSEQRVDQVDGGHVGDAGDRDPAQLAGGSLQVEVGPDAVGGGVEEGQRCAHGGPQPLLTRERVPAVIDRPVRGHRSLRHMRKIWISGSAWVVAGM
ncbi:hypothetical protein GCM10027590_35480 [Nocardiopsis nanhaiensis]